MDVSKCILISKYNLFIHSFIHLSTSIRRLTAMSFQFFLSSAALFTFLYVPKSVHSQISFIYIFIGQPTFIFPSTMLSSICRCDKPLEPLSTCRAYFIFLFIMSFVKCNSVCNSVCTRFMTFLVDILSFQTHAQYHSVTPPLKSIYLQTHLFIPSPTLTCII